MNDKNEINEMKMKKKKKKRTCDTVLNWIAAVQKA